MGLGDQILRRICVFGLMFGRNPLFYCNTGPTGLEISTSRELRKYIQSFRSSGDSIDVQILETWFFFQRVQNVLHLFRLFGG